MVGDLNPGGTGSYPGHQCDSPIQVRIDDMGIPIIDEGVTVYERKDGPTSISRRAEVHFPVTDGETVWLDEIDAFSDGGRMEQATVDMRPIDIDGNQSGDWERAIHGYVGAVGSRGAANTARITIFGPFKLLSSIPAGVSWNTDPPKAKDALEWVRDTFNQGQDIFDDVLLEMGEFPDDRFLGSGYKEDIDKIPEGIPSFTENRDTLADVVKMLVNRMGINIWFEPKESGVLALRAEPSLGDDFGDEYDLREGGDVPLISNDALYEMRPFNGLKIRGAQNATFTIPETNFTIKAPFNDGKYPQAVATYDPLVERAGGEITQTMNSKAATERSVRSEARAKLKSELDEISGGTMDTALAPFMHPHDTVVAKPACASVVDADVPALTYEIERAAHTLAPDPGDGEIQIPSTEIAVSMHIDPNEISVETDIINTQPSEEGDNRPPESSPDDGFKWDFLS